MSGVSHVILVSTGVVQEYIHHNIKHLISYGYRPHVIVDPENASQFRSYGSDITLVSSDDILIQFDDQAPKFSKPPDPVFWRNTAKRFFYIHSYIKQQQLTECLHLENDVLYYAEPHDLRYSSDRLSITMDHPDRCIPGIMYIPSWKQMETLVTNWDYTKHDMCNIAAYHNTNKCETLPIMKRNSHYDERDQYTCNFDKFKGVFDGAAIGQYISGVHNRQNPHADTSGFVNETCVVKYNHYQFKWRLVNGLKKLYIQIDRELVPVFNLHIHSKKLNNYV